MAHAVVHPRAVVVHLHNAPLALPAVVRPQRLVPLAFLTPLHELFVLFIYRRPTLWHEAGSEQDGVEEVAQDEQDPRGKDEEVYFAHWSGGSPRPQQAVHCGGE